MNKNIETGTKLSSNSPVKSKSKASSKPKSKIKKEDGESELTPAIPVNRPPAFKKFY